MTNEDAKYYAKTLTDVQREVILRCSQNKSWGYSLLTEKTGLNYDDVKSAGHFLQSANLAHVEHVRHGREFAGSAIFLNERGEQVREEAGRLRKKSSNAKN